MRLIAVIFFVLSIITFRSCGGLDAHEDVAFKVEPVYSGGILSLTPVIKYEGDEEAVFQFGSSIGWIDKVEDEAGIIYEYEEETLDVDQQTTLEKEEERSGFTVELNVEPGTYKVYMTAKYFLHDDENSEAEMVEYHHEVVKTLQIQ